MTRFGRRRQAPGELVARVAALERTALAWERTAISLAALGTVVFKVQQAGALVQGGGVVMVAGAVVLVLVVVPLGYRRARTQVLAGGPSVRLQGDDRMVGAVLLGTACVVSLAALFAGVEAVLLL